MEASAAAEDGRSAPPLLQDESVRKLVLRYHLGSLLVSNEFSLYFGHARGSLLTTHKLPWSTGSEWLGTEKPVSLPPLSRTVYSRWIRAIPWLEGHGIQFVRTLDAYVDSCWKGFVVSWLRATQFDMLGFAKHYYALFLFAYSDTRFDAAEVTCNPPQAGREPQSLQEFKDAIISHLARTGSHTGRFTTYPTSTQDVHASDSNTDSFAREPVRNPIQELRYKNLSNAFADFLHQGALILRNLQPAPDGSGMAFGPKLFTMLENAKSIDEAPEDLQRWVQTLCRALAVGFENVLDDPLWRGKAKRIWAKMPLNIIVTSLRIVNPAPFVDTLLRLFVWKPPGGLHSLLQSLAGVLCGMSKTRADVKNLRASLDPANRAHIDAIIDSLWNGTGGVSSNPADQDRVLAALAAAGVTVNPSYRDTADTQRNAHTRYARLRIREHEKMLFIDALGSDDVTGLIVHVVTFVAPVLKELWQCVQMADLLQCFFDTITRMLEVIGRYDVEEEVDLEADDSESDGVPPHALGEISRERYEHTIVQLEAALRGFFEAVYPVFHALSSRESAGHVGLHSIVDWIVREFGEGLRGWDGWAGSAETLGKRCVLDISALDAAEEVLIHCNGRVAEIWVEIDAVTTGLLVSGVDEHGWVTHGRAFALEDGVLGKEGVALFRDAIMEMDGPVLPDDEARLEGFTALKKAESTGVLGLVGRASSGVRGAVSRMASASSIRSFGSTGGEGTTRERKGSWW
ncbi:hypothetical protein BC830DRAFT_1136163 [Chytriomyces sp. MP71]|nr:hypothetical protein BC830DRAFT_1136163 [Chytriomyces sp. MP71]